MHFGAAHGPPAGLPQRVGKRTAGGGSLTQRGGGDGRALPLSGALSGGQQDLYNFPQNEMANLRQTQRKLKIARRETSS